jgi:hypothetical protein
LAVTNYLETCSVDAKAANTRRSYMLAHKQDDFAEVPKDARRSGSCEILYVVPANDNAKAGLSMRCWNLFRRLAAMHGFTG